MNILSFRARLRACLLSLLVAVGLSVVGCDSGGANGDSGPAWTGTWKVVSVTYPSGDELDPPMTTYWEITEETFTETTSRSYVGCVSSMGDDIDTEDDVLTYTQADGDTGTVKGQFEVSDGELTVDVMEASNESYTQITAVSVDPEDTSCLGE